MKKEYIGKWRIVDMELWGRDLIDLVVSGHLTVNEDGIGPIQFGAAKAELDCRVESVGEIERLEFTFEGTDEGDMVSGRGWACVEGPSISGRIYFHFGDDSSFTATRK